MIKGTHDGIDATSPARRASDIDFSCGFQSSLPAGTFASTRLVLGASRSSSARKSSVSFILRVYRTSAERSAIMMCSPMPLNPGQHLGPYQILALLGSGGMGEVYRASDARLGRDVAVKVLPAEFACDQAAIERFRREARLASTISHPHVCAIYDT